MTAPTATFPLPPSERGERGVAILAEGVLRIYGHPPVAVAALRGLDLRVDPGELVAIVGTSGSGKSTLLRLLGGLERPSAGRLIVGGIDTLAGDGAELAAFRRAQVGTVEQHYWRALSPHLPIREAIELPLRLRGWSGPSRAQRVDELLERIGLMDRAAALPAQLSGGQQQRVAVAVALAPRPRLLLADEPTGELDEATAHDLLELVGELVRGEGATAVIVTHDALVETIADRTVHLRDGRAVAVGGGREGVPLSPVVDTIGWTAPPLEPPAPSISPLPPAAGLGPAVELHGVTRSFGRGPAAVAAIEHLDAAFQHGGLHVVTGPSGSGKTTLLRLIAGLDRPDRGSVRTLGTDLATLDAEALAVFRGSRIAVVPQAPRLVPFLDARENVDLALAIRDPALAGAERSDRVDRALAEVGLEARAAALPDTLSGGERTRVAIARALVGAPELVLLDEPTAALDRATAARIIGLLAGLDRAGRTIVVATHDRDFIAAASDRLDLRRTP